MTLLNLPSHFTKLRPHQVRAISQVQAHYNDGKKYVFLDAPTGSGKTVIAEYVRQLNQWQAVYTCMTKSLQNQFTTEFDYAALLKGRNNYPSEKLPHVCADECQNQIKPGFCSYCTSSLTCPYQVAKDTAKDSELAVLNLDYLLLSCRVPDSGFGGRALCIIDEADELENKLMDFVTISISHRQQGILGIKPPNIKTYEARGSFRDWKEWAYETAERVTEYRAGLDKREQIKSYMYYTHLRKKLYTLYDSITTDPPTSNWIYVYDSKASKSAITFKPIHVQDTAAETLLDYQRRFLFMSATIVPEIEAEKLGIERGEYGIVTVPSTFPASNRPIYPIPVGSMAFKKRRETVPKVLQTIQTILDKHPAERVIVHTHTAHLAKQIAGGLRAQSKRPIYTYEGAGERDQALANYKSVSESVLVAMSMARGIDLPDDLCRVQVIALLPRLPINDQQISYRMHRTKGGNLWYNYFTIRSLVQATGRGVRSKDDHAVTYVLDSQFLDFHRSYERFFPTWWNEAVIWDGKMSKEILDRGE